MGTEGGRRGGRGREGRPIGRWMDGGAGAAELGAERTSPATQQGTNYVRHICTFVHLRPHPFPPEPAMPGRCTLLVGSPEALRPGKRLEGARGTCAGDAPRHAKKNRTVGRRLTASGVSGCGMSGSPPPGLRTLTPLGHAETLLRVTATCMAPWDVVLHAGNLFLESVLRSSRRGGRMYSPNPDCDRRQRLSSPGALKHAHLLLINSNSFLNFPNFVRTIGNELYDVIRQSDIESRAEARAGSSPRRWGFSPTRAEPLQPAVRPTPPAPPS